MCTRFGWSDKVKVWLQRLKRVQKTMVLIVLVAEVIEKV